MARISKQPDVRKAEIVQTAQMLFVHKGFGETKVSDIVKGVGVSQGVFYYYFKSKDDIIDEIVNSYISELVNGAKDIVNIDKLRGVEKFEKMAEHQLRINKRGNSKLHAIKGVDIQERILRRLIADYVPVICQALCGKEDKDLSYKLEIFVAAGNMLFNPDICKWDKNERFDRISHFVALMEDLLGVPRGAFSFYRKLVGFVE